MPPVLQHSGRNCAFSGGHTNPSILPFNDLLILLLIRVQFATPFPCNAWWLLELANNKHKSGDESNGTILFSKYHWSPIKSTFNCDYSYTAIWVFQTMLSVLYYQIILRTIAPGWLLEGNSTQFLLFFSGEQRLNDQRQHLLCVNEFIVLTLHYKQSSR